MNHINPNDDRGFTLIELLVVIAVITSMLLPALGEVKGVLCMNNAKQVMLASLLCLVNNEDKFPKNAHSGNKAIVA